MTEKQRRDALGDLGNLGETLSSLMGDHEEATKEVEEDRLQGARGRRKRPRFPSEKSRVKLTLDIDLEPAVSQVLQTLAGNDREIYGPGKIRQGDLATAALVLGLLEIASGEADIEPEWTSQSRGSRNVSLGLDLEEKWDILVQGLGIDRWEE